MLKMMMMLMMMVIMTVSYTHLRAHETEADLVCRLLLEKKMMRKNAQVAARDLREKSAKKVGKLIFRSRLRI